MALKPGDRVRTKGNTRFGTVLYGTVVGEEYRGRRKYCVLRVEYKMDPEGSYTVERGFRATRPIADLVLLRDSEVQFLRTLR